MDTTQRFRKLCDDNSMRAADVAKMMNRSIFTVRHWFSGSHYPIPEDLLELFELKLAKAKVTNQ